jgi:hypothetical protein
MLDPVYKIYWWVRRMETNLVIILPNFREIVRVREEILHNVYEMSRNFVSTTRDE